MTWLLSTSVQNLILWQEIPLVATVLAILALLAAWPFRFLTNPGAVAAWTLGSVVLVAGGRSCLQAMLAAVVPSALLARLAARGARMPGSLRQVVLRGAPPAVGALLMFLSRDSAQGETFFVGTVTVLGAGRLDAGLGHRTCCVRASGDRRSAGLLVGTRDRKLAWLIAGVIGSAIVVWVWTWTGTGTIPVLSTEFCILTSLGLAGLVIDRLLCAALQQYSWDLQSRSTGHARSVGSGEPARWPCDSQGLGSDLVHLVAGLMSGVLAVAVVHATLGLL